MKDLSCFIFIVLVALPYTFSAQLRKDHGLHGFRTGKKGFGMESKIKALSSATPYPSNPSFASIMYYNTSCDSVINQYEIFLTNTCLVDGDGSWSTMYTCEGTTMTQYCYTGPECSGSQYACWTVDQTCSGNENAQLYACTTNPQGFGTSAPLVDYGVYDTSSCNELIYAWGMLNNYCYFYGGDEPSWKYAWPYVSNYTSQDCSGPPLATINLETQYSCSLSEDDYLSLGDSTYSYASLIGQVPSYSPAHGPTVKPTYSFMPSMKPVTGRPSTSRPSATPTLAPTASPTLPFPTDPVYASMIIHSNNNCSAPVTAYYMYLANTCMEYYGSSLIYSCENNVMQEYRFNTPNCTGPSEIYWTVTPTCSAGASLYACTSDPTNYGTRNSLVQYGVYDASGCSQQLLYASAQPNNYCYKSSTTSWQWEWPYQDIYENAGNCTGPVDAVNVGTYCYEENTPSNWNLGTPIYSAYSYLSWTPTALPTVEPTLKPGTTRSPTPGPTTKPSVAPPVYPTNPLFASIVFHNSTCASPAVYFEVVLANTCLMTGESSTMYSCASGGSSVTISTYDNPTCSGTPTTFVLTNSCSDSDDGNGAEFYSCTSNSNGYGTTSPLVAMETFDTSICTEMIDGYAILNNYCYYTGGSGSFLVNYPFFDEYLSNDCTGPVEFSYSLAGQPSCSPQSSIFDDDYTYNLGTPLYTGFREVNSGSATTISPTRKPTFAPSAIVVSDLIFTSNITMDGITSTNLDSASQLAIINTTAWAMNVPMSYVSYVSAFVPATGRRLIAEEEEETKKGKDTEMVSSVSSSISMMKAFNQPHKRSFAARKARYGSPKIQARSTPDSYRSAADPHSQGKLSLPLKPSSIENTVGTAASSPIVVITKVTAPITSTMDSSTYYTQLTTSLSTSVSTGKYTQQLQSVSVSYGATQTENAVATNVTSSASTVVPVSDGSSSSTNTGLGAAGIAALTVILVSFVCAGTCYAVVYGKVCSFSRLFHKQTSSPSNMKDTELPTAVATPSAPAIAMVENPMTKSEP